MKNFVNIDSLINLKGRKLQIDKIFGENKNRTKDFQIYKYYEVKEGDTLAIIADKVFKEFPIMESYYTTDTLIELIMKSNRLLSKKVSEGDYIVIPCYINTISLKEKEELNKRKENDMQKLSDYEEYHVKTNETYFNLARMYTSDDKEIIKLVSEIQELNDYATLMPGMVITIPCIEKYKLMHEVYDERNKSL